MALETAVLITKNYAKKKKKSDSGRESKANEEIQECKNKCS